MAICLVEEYTFQQIYKIASLSLAWTESDWFLFDSSGDIMAQLAELGITEEATPPQQRPREESTDEFDIFAKSRTAYSPQG